MFKEDKTLEEILYSNYQNMSDEELKEISVENGYTDIAEKVAKKLIDDANREYKKRLRREQENVQKEQRQREEMYEKEKRKAEYAKSFNEYYEYDVVTALNVDGRVNKQKMIDVLKDYSSKGWKLHTVYSNELGKEAIRILGFGVNTTVAEDVMVFERRIENFEI